MTDLKKKKKKLFSIIVFLKKSNEDIFVIILLIFETFVSQISGITNVQEEKIVAKIERICSPLFKV